MKLLLTLMCLSFFSTNITQAANPKDFEVLLDTYLNMMFENDIYTIESKRKLKYFEYQLPEFSEKLTFATPADRRDFYRPEGGRYIQQPQQSQPMQQQSARKFDTPQMARYILKIKLKKVKGFCGVIVKAVQKLDSFKVELQDNNCETYDSVLYRQ